ncbi:MAG: hypothetical protein AAF721_09455 [Myxococcota bacterium]
MTYRFATTLPWRSALLGAAALLLTACPDDEPGPPLDTEGSSTGGECTNGGVGPDCGPPTTSGPGTTAAVDDAQPDSTSDDGTTPAETGADECSASSECDPDFCVAPFDPELGVFGRGPFACVAECVDLQDELRWCADASACCAPDAECTDRGYCELPGMADSTGGDSTSGDSTSGDSTTGVDDTGGDASTGTTGG